MAHKTGTFFATLIAAVALFALSANAQGLITSVSLGASTSPNGIVFTSTGGTGGLSVDIGGCPFSTSVTCTAPGAVTGSVSALGFGGSYSLSADSLTASFLSESPSMVDTWSLSGAADGFSGGITGFTGSVSGTISWLDVVEGASGVSLVGNAAYTSSGALSSYIGSGTAGFSILLAPLSCNSSVTGPCTLANISGEPGDPPGAFSSVGSGSFGATIPPNGATPEPSSLLLLGTGLLGLAPFVRRRFAQS
ncbi:MAG TPA: PEP-CTERM sorting domain-containing protein [Candidatus Acidoferrales bacterium]|nr:PEP-CTERM sorting domain-containing protein [Candidatus Acidoferrales bacterium]